MKKAIVFLALAFFFWPGDAAGQKFEKWFDEGVMRLDLQYAGTADQGDYAFEGMRREAFYSGSRTCMIDPFQYGDHKFEVKDAASGKLIYSQGYCTLFREWLTTTEALSIRRTYPHSLRFPWPKEEVLVEVYDRNREGEFILSWSQSFDPGSKFADPDLARPFEVADIEINGPAETKVDILFLAEGYTLEEMDKFLEDVSRSVGYIFSVEPFLSRRTDFNVRAVKSASLDSGTDIPGNDMWKNTVLNSTFYTFDIERYLTTADYTSVCDVAANAHYDQVYILVNTDKYGGGGIYNFYSMSAADNPASRRVVIHEFGHAFGGLADEYYNSSVAYNDFFPLDVEPWNPNLTTLVDFGSKWKDMLDPSTPVPTVAEEKNETLLGVYEGGGYVAKGVFRPMMDCMMHASTAGFCPVCRETIDAMIDRYTGERRKD